MGWGGGVGERVGERVRETGDELFREDFIRETRLCLMVTDIPASPPPVFTLTLTHTCVTLLCLLSG